MSGSRTHTAILAFLHGYLHKAATDLPGMPEQDDPTSLLDGISNDAQATIEDGILDTNPNALNPDAQQQAHRRAMLPKTFGQVPETPSTRTAIIQGPQKPQAVSQAPQAISMPVMPQAQPSNNQATYPINENDPPTMVASASRPRFN